MFIRYLIIKNIINKNKNKSITKIEINSLYCKKNILIFSL